MMKKWRYLINGLIVLFCVLCFEIIAPGFLMAASITLTTDNTTVDADGNSFATITATLLNDDAEPLPIPNVSVTFTTTIGYFVKNTKSPTVSVNTDSAGAATVFLYSDIPGTAVVSCTGQGATASIFVDFTGPGPTTDIVLSADPVSIPADNQSFSTISATLYDQNGQLASAGQLVVFESLPAAAGKPVLGLFSNGNTLITASTNDQGVASTAIFAGSLSGTAKISATWKSADGTVIITRYVNVVFTGAAFISLSASPSWIPADGYTFTAITAVIFDNSGQPVASGTPVSFSTTALGVFENGKTTYTTITTGDTGTVTVHLRASSPNVVGQAVITCTAGSATQSLTIDILHLEYETEPNNDMAHADGICFYYEYLGQIENPYLEDWYTFTLTTNSRIGINFVTTASPADAGCDSGTTTVGTWKVDIRDSDNNILMSRHNIDCIFDNGIWATGVVPPGTYYVVVYCPRLGSGDIYLADDYYLSVFNNFYFPCGDSDKLVNAATLSQESSVYQMHVPILYPAPYVCRFSV